MSLLTLNVGSSSIKLALFTDSVTETPSTEISLEDIGQPYGTFIMGTAEQRVAGAADHTAALNVLLTHVERLASLSDIHAVGHRVVFGGPNLGKSQEITPEVIQELKRYESFDADHMPYILATIAHMQSRLPQARHIACFDTAFFAELPLVAQMLPIPRKYFADGIKKYGYHGLSYTSIMSTLQTVDAQRAAGKVIVAHLGSGCSLAAIDNGKPIDTTMSFTPTSGIPMSSRSGDLDPSVATFLQQDKLMTVQDFSFMVNHQSGLLGISETTADMQTLLKTQSTDSRAAEAINLFSYRITKAIGELVAALGGLDMLVFTGGIGSRSAEIRSRICERLEFLNITLDASRNENNEQLIAKDGTIPVRVIQTNEALVIAQEVHKVIRDTKF